MEKPSLPIPDRLQAHAGVIQAMLEPCVDLHLSPRGSLPEPEGSRLFGRPFLHHVGDWPRTPEGRPLHFLAQVNLEKEVLPFRAAQAILPSTGALSFFYDLDALPQGRDPEDRYRFRVLWTPDLSCAKTIDPPPGVRGVPTQEWSLSGLAGWRLPSEVDARFLLEPLDEEGYAAYAGLADAFMAPSDHRLLGPADWLEGDARAQCAEATARLWGASPAPVSASSWRLLWQVGGEPDLDALLGDDVRIYVMIREEDLAERRFIRSWAVMQWG